MSKLHFGGHRLRIARHRLIREYAMAGRYPECGRCGRVIDPTLSGLHPDGATVGHRVPVSRGGDDSYENLRLEHRRCNLAAGARLTPPVATVVEPITMGLSTSGRFPQTAARLHPDVDVTIETTIPMPEPLDGVARWCLLHERYHYMTPRTIDGVEMVEYRCVREQYRARETKS